MLTREELEKKEDSNLASYAMRSMNTRGRAYPEEEHPYQVSTRETKTGLSTLQLSGDWNIRRRSL